MTGNLVDELMREHKAGVTRSDYWAVIIAIVLETHPEIYKHPKMVEFMAKVRNYQAIRQGEDYCGTR